MAAFSMGMSLAVNEPCIDVLNYLRRCITVGFMAVNPQTLIQQLLESGMKECEIGEALRADGTSVSDATLNRIKSGLIKRTGFDIGMALMRLHRRTLSGEHA